MKQSRLVWTSFAFWAVASFTTLLLTSGAGAGNSASKASGCPASAQCSAAQAAACKASGMKCSAGASSAASLTLVTAGSAPSSGKGQSCSDHGASASAAQAAPPACRGDGGVKMADASAHLDCDGCADMSRCAQEISGAGGRVQIVPLKNGVMYVYTAESSSGVRAVQAAISHRNERLAAWTTDGDHVKLCSECKSMRGAAASGKLNREVVNIEGGCLTLMTSSDPTIVTRLHEMASQAAVRTKI